MPIYEMKCRKCNRRRETPILPRHDIPTGEREMKLWMLGNKCFCGGHGKEWIRQISNTNFRLEGDGWTE